jgi:methionyl-tRNA formyltransferase
MPIDINTRIGEVYEWLDGRIPVLMCSDVKKLSKIPNYLLEIQSIDSKNALRCYPRMPQDGKIDWSKNAEAVLRLVNASSEPFAGAFAEYENDKIIIWRAKLEVDSEVFVAVNGQVLKIGQDYIVVSCKNSKLRITEVGYKGVEVTLVR